MDDRLESSELPTSPVVSDAFYRHFCEHAGIALISTDRNLIIQTWNSAASRMFGASAANMIGSPFESAIPHEDRVEGERLMHEAIESGIVVNFEFKHRDAYGRSRTLIATFSTIASDQGHTIGALACIRDITRRINLEADLAQRNKMASLGQMAGTLAHHFNNILGGAVTSIDFALSTDDPSLQTRALRQTGDALARMTTLVDALVAFAEGDVKHHDQCDLTEAIIEVLDHIESEMVAANITLEVNLGQVPITPVPRAQLVTVLENVFHNAADALPVGGTVAIDSFVDHNIVTVTIRDNGCGMTDDECGHIFEPFFSTKNLDANLTRHPGLGLAVAHGILHVLGHTIDIESSLGEGTTVTIRFFGDTTPLT